MKLPYSEFEHPKSVVSLLPDNCVTPGKLISEQLESVSVMLELIHLRSQHLSTKCEKLTVTFESITFLIQKHFKTVTVTVILRKLIQMTL